MKTEIRKLLLLTTKKLIKEDKKKPHFYYNINKNKFYDLYTPYDNVRYNFVWRRALIGYYYGDIKKLFIQFLNDKNIFDSFKNNVLKYNTRTYKTFDDLLNFHIFNEYVNYGFTWAKTKEGDVYWCKIHDEWQTCCNQMINVIKKHLYDK